MQQPVISVVIPAYNEAKTIGNVLSDTTSTLERMGMPYEVFVVDDGSVDGTREIATRYKATVLFNGRNHGKGYTLRKGFRHAHGDIIVAIDSDGTHKPEEIPRLIAPLFNGVDIVAGSRFLGDLNGSTTRLNKLGNFLFNTTIMMFTGKRVTDSQSGFRAFKREALEELDLTATGYEIETEMTVKGLKNGFVYHEQPIGCKKRKDSASKLRILSDGMRILKTILIASTSRIR